MLTKILSPNKVAVLTAALFALAASVSAAPSIVFPVVELGNCANAKECRAYCDNPDHFVACTDFGRKQGIISEEKAKYADKFAAIVKNGGPGACRTAAVCQAYCESSEHVEECTDFAARNGLIDSGRVEEARKISRILRDGSNLPGSCRTKQECEKYCNVSEHREECLAFAERTGFIRKQDADAIRGTSSTREEGESRPSSSPETSDARKTARPTASPLSPREYDGKKPDMSGSPLPAIRELPKELLNGAPTNLPESEKQIERPATQRESRSLISSFIGLISRTLGI
jgi:hypothetical protein